MQASDDGLGRAPALAKRAGMVRVKGEGPYECDGQTRTELEPTPTRMAALDPHR
jgi:hypothetical protein